MEQIFYGMNCNYIERDGYHLVISRDNLTRQELDPLAVKMIEATGNIPGLLPIMIEEKDFLIRLHYNYGAMRPLKSVFRGQAIQADQFNQMLLSIINTIEQSKNYMLKEQHYLLNEDFIFVGEDIGKTSLLYLPLNELEHKKPLVDQLKELITGLSELSDNLTANLVVLKKYLRSNEDKFSIKAFKQYVVSLLNKGPIVKPVPRDHDRYPEKKIIPPEVDKNNRNTSKEMAGNKTSVLIPLVIAFILIVVIWKFYSENPYQAFLYISLGCTLLIFGVLVLMFYFSQPGVKEKVGADKEIQQDRHDMVRPDHQREIGNLSSSGRLSPTVSNKTVFLLQEDDGEAHIDAGKYPYLEVMRKDGPERIEINKKSFVIGRNPETVDFVESSNSVSRAHLEFTTADGKYYARDLGSTNGTHLNDEIMIPQKNYPLEDGDVLRIVKIEYTFKTGT